jgi:hypothetical protein
VCRKLRDSSFYHTLYLDLRMPALWFTYVYALIHACLRLVPRLRLPA